MTASPPSDNTPGLVAFYFRHAGEPEVEWDELPKQERDLWENAAEAVLEAFTMENHEIRRLTDDEFVSGGPCAKRTR